MVFKSFWNTFFYRLVNLAWLTNLKDLALCSDWVNLLLSVGLIRGFQHEESYQILVHYEMILIFIVINKSCVFNPNLFHNFFQWRFSRRDSFETIPDRKPGGRIPSDAFRQGPALDRGSGIRICSCCQPDPPLSDLLRIGIFFLPYLNICSDRLKNPYCFPSPKLALLPLSQISKVFIFFSVSLNLNCRKFKLFGFP
jgi:hypothetical protein